MTVICTGKCARDGIASQKVTTADTEYFCKVYNPKDEHLLAGSCHSGQVVWWDTRAGGLNSVWLFELKILERNWQVGDPRL